MRRVKRLSDMILSRQKRFGVVQTENTPPQFAIYDNDAKGFVSGDRWTTRRASEDYLTVSLMLKQ